MNKNNDTCKQKTRGRFWRDSFQRDILVLLFLSIFIGALLAGAVSLTTNKYFSQTVSNLVGDYGEHDLVLQSREEIRADALNQIKKIIAETLPGAVLKEGAVITGKASFFIALPKEYKTKEIYADLNKIFASVPGGAGVGVITEPKLNVRGVPEGAREMVISAIEEMDGVKFAFRDGSSIAVILKSLEKTGAVSSKIKTLLADYQILEISFPPGSEPLNAAKMGTDVAAALEEKLKLPYAESVSGNEQKGDLAYLTGTMSELKKFLAA
ncbi:MAG: hypothetical protein LBR56_05390, partial [Sporomusaceae bacterium]|nr:hypothetical protein [Sporomusaceae bacterium]